MRFTAFFFGTLLFCGSVFGAKYDCEAVNVASGSTIIMSTIGRFTMDTSVETTKKFIEPESGIEFVCVVPKGTPGKEDEFQCFIIDPSQDDPSGIVYLPAASTVVGAPISLSVPVKGKFVSLSCRL